MNAKIPIILVCFLFATACAESELAPDSDAGGRVEPDASVESDMSGNNVEPDMSVAADAGPADAGATDSGQDSGNTADIGIDAAASDSGIDAGVDAGTPGPCDDEVSSQGWEAVGGAISALAGATDAQIPDIAIDDQCRPVIAFHESALGEEENVFVYRWNGTAWRQLGGAIDATGQSDKWTTGVRLETYGSEIYIQWAEITLNNQVSVFVARWTGTRWNILGDTGATGLLSFDMSLAVDNQGRPIAAWHARDGFNMPTMVRIARWDDPNWTPLGGPLRNNATGNIDSFSPELVIDAGGNPVVAWEEQGKINSRRWNGSSWVAVNGAPFDAVMDPSGATDSNVALTPTGEILYGWRESGGSTNVYVESWDGANFSTIANTLDAEPETGGRTNTQSLDIAVDSRGRTSIVFDEPISNGGRERVHVFRHDSNGLGRLAAGILDVNLGDTGSKSPQVAIDPADRVYVVFVERGTQSIDVHVWRYTD